jgi:hypothetical protein
LSEKNELDGKIDALSGDITHLSEKLQRLLDAFLDGVLEREDYTQKKAEIMSQKKTLEEQMSDFYLGNLVWVEPLNSWLNKAVSICKIAKSADQNAKKALLLEIYGLNLIFKNKNAVASSDPKSHSPQENIWSVLRTANIKIARMGDNYDFSPDLEPRSRIELETSSLPWMRSTTELSGLVFSSSFWSHLSDSNRRPSVYKTDALTN